MRARPGKRRCARGERWPPLLIVGAESAAAHDPRHTGIFMPIGRVDMERKARGACPVLAWAASRLAAV